MRIKQHDYIDWNSPGTMSPVRGERPEEAPLGDVDLGDDLSLEMVELTKRTAYRPTDPELLPAERFSDAPAPAWQCRLIDAPTSPDQTRECSRSVRFRFAVSCAGWRRRPTAAEFYEAVRAEVPTERQRALLDTWATEAEWEELLAAWTEHAYTFHELAAALHRAGLLRCRAAAALNRWAIYPGQPGIDEC